MSCVTPGKSFAFTATPCSTKFCNCFVKEEFGIEINLPSELIGIATIASLICLLEAIAPTLFFLGSKPHTSIKDPVVGIDNILSLPARPEISCLAGPLLSVPDVLGFVVPVPDPRGAAFVALVICSNGFLTC